MARVETIVVGGGISAGSPFALKAIPFIANSDPPTLQSSPIMAQVTGTNQAIIISPTGADPEASTKTLLRVVGGIASFPDATANGLLRCVLGARQTLTNLAGVNNQTIIGNDINVDTLGTGSTVVGKGFTRTATGGGGSTVVTALGSSITVGGGMSNVICIGDNITLGDNNGGASGSNVYIGGSISITGGGATATQRNTLIGFSITQGAGFGINSVVGSLCALGTAQQMACVGYNNAFSNGLAYGSVLGLNNTIAHSECVLLGSGITTTANNQCLIGGLVGGSGFISTVIVGRGDTASNPGAITFRITNATGADIAGADLNIVAGRGTGNAVQGNLVFQVGDRNAASASTLRSAFNAILTTNNTTDVSTTFDSIAASTKNVSIRINTAGTLRSMIGVAGANNGLIAGSVAGESIIRTETQRLLFSFDGGATIHADFTTAGVLELNVNRGLRFNNATNSAGAVIGTLNNAPTVGDPGFWLKINIGGTNYAIPCWLG